MSKRRKGRPRPEYLGSTQSPNIGYLYTFVEPEPIDGFTITFKAEEEFLTLKEAFSELEPRDLRDLKYRIDCDATVYFQAIVEARRQINGYPRDAVGTAALGCCCYDSYEQFHTEHREDYYRDMINEAVQQAAMEEARILTELFTNLNQQHSFEQKMGGTAGVYLKLTAKGRNRSNF